MSRAIRTRIMSGAFGGYYCFILVQSEFRKQWKMACDILEEKPRTFKLKFDAEQYAVKAAKKVNGVK